MSSTSASNFSKRSRVVITILSVTVTASVMLMVLARISRSSAKPLSTSAAHITPATTTMRRVLAFGDSLTAGTSGYELFPYAPVLEKALQRENTAVRHRGMPGWTTQMMLDNLDDGQTGLRSAISKGHPDVVIILAGTNDLGYGESEETITNNLKKLHGICYENGVARTVAVGVPPSGYQAQVKKAADLVEAINGNLQRFAESGTKTTYTPFPFRFEQGGENWYFDGLHFSETGYRVLGESLAPVVDQVLRNLDEEEAKRSS